MAQQVASIAMKKMELFGVELSMYMDDDDDPTKELQRFEIGKEHKKLKSIIESLERQVAIEAEQQGNERDAAKAAEMEEMLAEESKLANIPKMMTQYPKMIPKMMTQEEWDRWPASEF